MTNLLIKPFVARLCSACPIPSAIVHDRLRVARLCSACPIAL